MAEEAKKEAEAPPVVEAGGGKKKKLILIIVGVVVLGGVGAGAMLFLGGAKGKDSASSPAATEEHKEAAGKTEEHGEAKGGDKAKSESGGHGEAKDGAKADAKDGKAGGGGHETADGKDAKAGEHGEAKDGKGAEGAKDKGGKDKKLDIDFGDTFAFKTFHINLGNPLENRYVRMDVSVEFLGGTEQHKELEKRSPQLRDAVVSVVSRKSREFLLGPDGKDRLRLELLNRINSYMTKKIHAVFITDILIE